MQFIQVCKRCQDQSDSVPKFWTKFSVPDTEFGLVRCGYVSTVIILKSLCQTEQWKKLKFYQTMPWGTLSKHLIKNQSQINASWQNQQCGCAPSEDSDQTGHPPSLIRVFAVRMKKAWVLSYPLSAQRRLWSDWADAQADLSLRWAHSHFVGFVMRRLKCFCSCQEN